MSDTPGREAHRVFAGVIPSAGSSLRMGRPKALLEVDGETFLRRAVQTLATAGCEPVFVVVAEGDDTTAAEAERAGALVLTNPDPGEGPITSFRIALAALADSVAGVAYLPVDHPMVRTRTVATLLEAALSTDAPLIVPIFGSERGHPALFSADLFPELSDPALEGGARTVVHRHLLEALLVEVDDPGVVTDIDTPEAYGAAIAGRPRGSEASP